MTLYLIRHAHAGNKHHWSGPDVKRPLSKKGRAQAAALADRLGEDGIKRIISSPAVRCRQTVQPLAERLGVRVDQDDSLAEGASTTGALQLLHELAAEGTAAVLCSHGDVIPALVGDLERRGLTSDGNVASAKAGTFILDTRRGEITHALYVPPPDVRGLKG